MLPTWTQGTLTILHFLINEISQVQHLKYFESAVLTASLSVLFLSVLFLVLFYCFLLLPLLSRLCHSKGGYLHHGITRHLFRYISRSPSVTYLPETTVCLNSLPSSLIDSTGTSPIGHLYYQTISEHP